MEYLLLFLPIIILVLCLLLLKNTELSPDRISAVVLGIVSSRNESTTSSDRNRGNRKTKQGLFARLYLLVRDKNSKSSQDIAKLLLRAGVRGENSVEVFRFTRLIVALSLGGLALLLVTFAQEISLSIPLKIVIVIVAGLVGFYLPTILMINNAQKRRDEIKAGIPDMLDLMVICIQGGLSLEPALARVASEISFSYKVLSEELTSLNVELSYLGDRFQAYQNLQERVDLPEIKSLASMMYQSEKLGTPLSVAFNTLAAETRTERMSFAEKKAGALSSKLTVPMILFFVPAMFVVIMGPPILQLLNM
jgi:tight adherence protein C